MVLCYITIISPTNWGLMAGSGLSMDLSKEAVGAHIVGGLASFLLIEKPDRAPDCSRTGAIWFSGAPGGEWEEGGGGEL